MKFNISHKLLIISFLIFTYININAQLYAPGAAEPTWIPYKTNPVPVRLFAFNLQKNYWNELGKLKAVSPDKLGGWKFTWSYYDISSRSLTDTLTAFIDVDSMELDNLKQGCYKVRMTKNNVDTSFYGWIVLNKLNFYLVKTEDGFVKDFEYTCDYLDLRAVPKKDQHFDSALWYYHDDFNLINPETNNDFYFNNTITATITSSDTTITIKKPGNIRIIRIYDPPAENTKYTVTLKDSLGNTATDVVTYKTINTKADFKMYLALDSNAGENFKKNYLEIKEGEAKLWGKFVNTSKNGVNFEWRLADFIYNPLDSAQFLQTTTDSTDSIVDVIYRYPKKYKVILISTSAKSCADTATKELTVIDSKIGNLGENAFPKVFSPGNADNKNDYFYLKTDTFQSLRNLKLYIYNSRGKFIYEYSGKVAKGWQGWDGKTKWGFDAPPGLYFYYFEALGWGPFVDPSATETEIKTTPKTNKDYIPKPIKSNGYFYLFRDNQ